MASGFFDRLQSVGQQLQAINDPALRQQLMQQEQFKQQQQQKLEIVRIRQQQEMAQQKSEMDRRSKIGGILSGINQMGPATQTQYKAQQLSKASAPIDIIQDVLKPTGVGSTGGATGALVSRLMQENPSLSFADALGQVQTGFRKGVTFQGGRAEPIAGLGAALGGVAAEETRAETPALAERAQQVAEAKVIGSGDITEREKLERSKIEDKSLATQSLLSAQDQAETINKSIDEALEKADAFTTGFGSLLSAIPGTNASDLAGLIKTIQADAAFDRLQQMRDSSKTGGALGNVSERELGLLTNARTALEQSQSPSQFKRNLERYKKVRSKALQRVEQAYNKDYGSLPLREDIFKEEASGMPIDVPSELPETGGIKFLGFE